MSRVGGVREKKVQTPEAGAQASAVPAPSPCPRQLLVPQLRIRLYFCSFLAFFFFFLNLAADPFAGASRKYCLLSKYFISYYF